MKKCGTVGDSAHAGPSGESHIAQHTGKALAVSTSYSKIIVDSGATDNMFASCDLITNFQPKNDYPHVTVANGLVIPTNGSGTTRLFSKDIEVTIVPDLKANLLSVSKCTNQLGCNVLFTPQKVLFQDRISGKTIGEGHQVDGLYVIKPEKLALTTTNETSTQLWHKRLGHPSARVLQHLNLSPICDFNNCEPCQLAKSNRLPFF